jgi:hypothetical protein
MSRQIRQEPNSKTLRSGLAMEQNPIKNCAAQLAVVSVFLSTSEAESGRLQFQGLPELHTDFKASLGNLGRP